MQLGEQMDRQQIPHKVHYHILWRGKSEPDWEAFDTGQEATERARQLARPGESFVIEMHDDAACRTCRWMKTAALTNQRRESV